MTVGGCCDGIDSCGETVDLFTPSWTPPMRREIRGLVLRLARENPRWRYQRIVGELKGLGVTISATTVRTWLRAAGFGPAGRRGGLTWREFVRIHRRGLLAVDFFTVETIWLQRLYVLFFIELGSRRVHLAGCSSSPSSQWVTQQARQLSWRWPERREPVRFLFATETGNPRPVSTRCFAVTDRGCSHAVSCPASQRGGGAVRADRPLRVFGLAPGP
jgi:hypothetical protein